MLKTLPLITVTKICVWFNRKRVTYARYMSMVQSCGMAYLTILGQLYIRTTKNLKEN